MSKRLLPFIPAGLVVDRVHAEVERLIIHTHPRNAFASCPACGRSSSRLHSRYARKLADLPWQGRAVMIEVRARRFRCVTAGCTRRVFVERLIITTPPHARRTARLADIQRHLGLALGGEPGSRLATRLVMPVSGDTILRLVRAGEPAPYPSPRVVGIDDWAFRRGQSYGTIVCDLERRRVLDLLPGRNAETVATWLKQHPSVEVVARDRAGAYAEGARSGAPGAIQVADRWHLLRNLGDVMQGLVDRHRRHVHAAGRVVARLRHIEHATASPPALTQEQRLRSDRQRRREERFAAMQRMKGLGLTLIEIGANLGISGLTVQRWLKAGASPSHNKPAQPSTVDRHGTYLERRWQQGCRNATLLWREVQSRGYQGSERTLRRWMAQRRQSGANRREIVDAVAATAWKVPSSRRCARWLATPPDKLDPREREFLDSLRVSAPALVYAGELASAFAAMMRERAPDTAHATLGAWLDQARDSLLASFGRGLERDRRAVHAALVEPWSTSPVEGHISRLKMLKRQMFGRAKLDLLRRRVIRAA